VPVAPAVVGRQEVAQGGEQVVVGAGPGLDDREPGRRVRHEDVQEPVAAVGDEVGRVAGQVEHDLLAARAVGAGLTVHGRPPG
jgi:hypothetical protein